MPSIYLRVPYYVASYYRNRFDDKRLKESEPYSFSIYTDAFHIIINAAMYTDISYKIDTPCFSEKAWNRMTDGYGVGEKTSRKRIQPPLSDGEYLNDKDINTLSGKNFGNKEGFGDYLKIALPTEIMRNGKMLRVNTSYTLPKAPAFQLVAIMKKEFRKAFLNYMRKDEEYCAEHGINRHVMESISRFMTRYDIPFSQDRSEISLLKRNYYRWKNEDGFSTSDRIEFGYIVKRPTGEFEDDIYNQ